MFRVVKLPLVFCRCLSPVLSKSSSLLHPCLSGASLHRLFKVVQALNSLPFRKLHLESRLWESSRAARATSNYLSPLSLTATERAGWWEGAVAEKNIWALLRQIPVSNFFLFIFSQNKIQARKYNVGGYAVQKKPAALPSKHRGGVNCLPHVSSM